MMQPTVTTRTTPPPVTSFAAAEAAYQALTPEQRARVRALVQVAHCSLSLAVTAVVAVKPQTDKE